MRCLNNVIANIVNKKGNGLSYDKTLLWIARENLEDFYAKTKKFKKENIEELKNRNLDKFAFDLIEMRKYYKDNVSDDSLVITYTKDSRECISVLTNKEFSDYTLSANEVCIITDGMSDPMLKTIHIEYDREEEIRDFFQNYLEPIGGYDDEEEN